MIAPRHGLALRCTQDGRVVERIRDDLDPEDAIEVGSLLDILDPGSTAKGIAFLREVGDTGAAYGWELDVVHAGLRTRLRFVGVREDNEIVIVATSEPGQYEGFITDLTGVQNDLVNRLRRTAKAAANDTHQLDELTALNNELTNLQRELARKNAELVRMDGRKNQLLGMAAHDLRTPLSAIMGFSEVLLMMTNERLTEREQAMLERILDSSQRMTTLVGDLLSVAEIESGQVQLRRADVDLSALVEDNVEVHRSLADRKSIEILVEAASTVSAHVDPDKVGQVVSNLLTNAIKFSHPATTVRVQVSAADGEATIRVSDEGQGIPADELDQLFEPFAKTSVRGTDGERSTGLGLAIVRSLVDGHGGRVEVDSNVGKGSTFSVTLPVTAPAGSATSS